MVVTEHLQDDRTRRNNGHRQMAGSGIRPKERPKVDGPLHQIWLVTKDALPRSGWRHCVAYPTSPSSKALP